jgi:hypothetical protein
MHPGVARDTGYFTSDPKQRPTRDYKRDFTLNKNKLLTDGPPRVAQWGNLLHGKELNRENWPFDDSALCFRNFVRGSGNSG